MIQSLSVSTTITDAVKSLVQDSVAIYRLDREDETAKAIDRARVAANELFHSEESVKLKCHRLIIDGHLHGMNIPSSAKVLFRAFCGSKRQPWPNSEFQEASTLLSNLLHGLLIQCCREIDSWTVESRDEKTRNPPKLPTPCLIEDCVHLPLTAENTTHCPLDFFLYHGLQEGGNPLLRNCTEHVDRGLLIAVCLSTVPGLEVLLSRQGESFVCPEEMLHTNTEPSSFDPGSTSSSSPIKSTSRYICIMVGDELQRIRPDIPSCVHRVRDELEGERLSITYELRTAPRST